MSRVNTILIVIKIVIISHIISSQEIHVRKNAKYLTFNEWQEYRHAIQLLKEISERNKFDPKGYSYQSNIHGWEKYDGSPQADRIAERYNWHRCQHGQYFFLVWHRMYLYFFERILRKVSKNNNIAIPYWDYYDTEQRSIPEPFRIPANNKTNALYVSQRCKSMNYGKPLSGELVSPFPALNSNFFTTNKENNELNVCHSLGGARVDKPAFEGDREGLMEMIPHDNIHLFVGGPNGHMSDNCRSSRDPVFMLHHTQIDRIWESWVQAGGENIRDSKYLNQTFDFFDENGKRFSVRVADFLNITRLRYRYDSLIDIKDNEYGYKYKESPELHVSIDESDRKNLVVTTNDRSLNLLIKPEYQTRFKSLAKNSISHIRSTLQLSIDYLESDLIFHVYLNLPEKTDPNENKPYFIGAITYIQTKCVPKTKRQEMLNMSHCFDVTHNLQQVLRNIYNYNGYVPESLNLTFVPKSCDIVYNPRVQHDLIVFNRILLIHFIY